MSKNQKDKEKKINYNKLNRKYTALYFIFNMFNFPSCDFRPPFQLIIDSFHSSIFKFTAFNSRKLYLS